MMIRFAGMTRERKMILIGGAVLLILAAVYRFWPAMASMVSVADEISMKQAHVAKYRRIAEQKDLRADENAALRRQFRQLENRLLTGETPSLAAVEIQNALNTIAASGNVKFSTMRVMKPVEGEGVDFVRIPVQLSMDTDINRLKDVIYNIEASPLLLVITELNTSLARSRDGRLIRTTMTVEGVMKTPPPEG